MAISARAVGGNHVVLEGAIANVLVISTDPELIKLCRDVLRDVGDSVGHGDSAGRSNCRICLWDYESGNGRPWADQINPGQVLYLVPPARLASLLEEFPESAGHILLKPLTRAVLQAFLVSMNLPKPRTDGADVASLRSGRDELLQRLLHANLRLQEYDQQRTNFIARAVHDFRAPLTALSGFCGLLGSGQLGPLNDRQKEALYRMENSAKRLSSMASAMFELSIGVKVDRRPKLEPGDIRDRIAQALHEIRPLARDKQILIKADMIEAPAQALYFDSVQIDQVLVNLFDNACKFTHRKGMIEIQGYSYFWERRFLSGSGSGRERRVRLNQAPNAYRIDVRDTGPGIPVPHLNHIFEEYTSYSGSHDRSGGGLGLAICRMIISRHDGHIWANSHPNGGFFSFVLPYRHEPPKKVESPAGDHIQSEE